VQFPSVLRELRTETKQNTATFEQLMDHKKIKTERIEIGRI
jgi:hypothetical protein